MMNSGLGKAIGDPVCLQSAADKVPVVADYGNEFVTLLAEFRALAASRRA
jgi:hypothetical protein